MIIWVYRFLFENMAQGAFFQGADGALLDVNAAALRMLGLSRQEFLSLPGPAWDLVEPGGVALSSSDYPWVAAFRMGQPVPGILLGVRRGDERAWLEVSAVPEFQPGDARPKRVMVTMHDVSERKQAEDGLRAASLYSRTLIETSLDPLVTISAAGKVTDVNTATEKITGQQREQLIGSDFAQHFTDPDMARAGYQKAFAQGQEDPRRQGLLEPTGSVCPGP